MPQVRPTQPARPTSFDVPAGTSFDPPAQSSGAPTLRLVVSPGEYASTEALADQIAELSAYMHAAEHRLLELILEFDVREGWGDAGFRSCAQWLSWRTGVAPGAARERVRVARALASLPEISQAMRRGQLSYSKVRAVSRVATPDNERELLEFALAGTAAHVERLIRGWRRVDRLEAAEEERHRHAQRFLEFRTEEDGSVRIEGKLDPEVAAVLRRALDAAAEALLRRPGTGERNGEAGGEAALPSATQRRADALGLLAEQGLASGFPDSAPGSRADRFQVVVHIEAEELPDKAPSGGAVLDGHLDVPAGTFRRLSCDSSKVQMTHGADGGTLSVGRRTRTVPPAIRRALRHRDGGCRFPGCGNRFADAHHIRHWADGGETRLDNLVLLCRYHHRAVHEGGFTVTCQADGSVRFTDSMRRPLETAPMLPKVPTSWSATRRERWPGVHTTGDMTPWSCASRWAGESWDLDLALQGLRGPQTIGRTSARE